MASLSLGLVTLPFDLLVQRPSGALLLVPRLLDDFPLQLQCLLSAGAEPGGSSFGSLPLSPFGSVGQSDGAPGLNLGEKRS